VKIPESDITLRGGVLTIRGSSMLKHQLYTKKKEILTALKEYPETERIVDIQ
jgi:hypothetical protein